MGRRFFQIAEKKRCSRIEARVNIGVGKAWAGGSSSLDHAERCPFAEKDLNARRTHFAGCGMVMDLNRLFNASAGRNIEKSGHFLGTRRSSLQKDRSPLLTNG